MLALGCMRLSDPAVDPDRAVRVIHAALDAGVTLLDTADVYAPTFADVGHNETLVANALRTYPGDISNVVIATKGGLTRTEERWIPNGTAAHLKRAAQASLYRLGLPRLPLYQLHTPDPARKLSTGLKALKALQQDGLLERVGLSNINRTQLEQALDVLKVDTVQVALSPWNDHALRGGVVALCHQHHIRVLAHTPLGGPSGIRKCEQHPIIREVADALGLSVVQVVLAWMEHLNVVPLVGCTHETSAQQLKAVTLPSAMLQKLDAAFPSHVHAETKHAPASHVQGARVVVLMGMPGAGKSSLSEKYTRDGFLRLNRDEQGGTLKHLIPRLHAALEKPGQNVIMDNTYVSRASRQRVLEAAHAHGARVECVHVDTDIADAQVNAVWRMLEQFGRLPDAAEIRTLSKTHPAAFLPGAQFKHRDALEPPHVDEGFSSVERVPFVRHWPDDHEQRALILELDGVVRTSAGGHRVPVTPEDVVLLPNALELVQRFSSAGFLVLGTSWRPELTAPDAGAAVDERTSALLGGRLGDSVSCVHAAGPPLCWCRKPLHGMGVLLIRRHKLRPGQCVVVGKSASDRTWAQRLGMRYVDVGAVSELVP